MLKVVGESMIDAAICDGDYVIVRQQKTAENGDIVAAMIDGEATVEAFKQENKAKSGCCHATQLSLQSTAPTAKSWAKSSPCFASFQSHALC
jgi:hypothetical protein